MGQVVEFPQARRSQTLTPIGEQSEPAHVIILPVVRIERHPDGPPDGLQDGHASARRRRRRTSRS